ncbi:hypothetical protein [Thermodesulfovibrio hydrogeniphilus]
MIILKILLIVSVLVFVFVSSYAVDELYLTGKVLAYEPETGKIKVEVYSESCKGIREFMTEKGLSKDLLINKTIDFGIDSDHCDRDRTHRITTPLLK